MRTFPLTPTLLLLLGPGKVDVKIIFLDCFYYLFILLLENIGKMLRLFVVPITVRKIMKDMYALKSHLQSKGLYIIPTSLNYVLF